MKLKIIFLLFIIGVNAAEKARYDNYRVYEVKIENEKQVELMNHILESPNGYDFMRYANKIGGEAHLVVPPHKFGEWSEYIENFNLQARLLTSNLQENMDNEITKPNQRQTLDWTFYWTNDQVNSWIDGIVAQFPGSVTPTTIGTSFQGRPIRGVRVNIGGGSKPAVLIESTIHAREWIVTATTTFVLNEFLTSTNPAIMAVARRYIWHIIPVANPDGYIFSHTNNRMWRKTRRPSSAVCFGADPNRNFDHNWGQAGTSTNPCSDIFPGDRPFSEPETQALADYYTRIPNLAAYLSMHSFGQMILIPPGYRTTPTWNAPTLLEVARRSIESLTARFGTPYRLGTITEIFSVITGNSIDWVHDELRPNLTYAYEFRDTGATGFILPPAQIIPNSLEVLDSLIRMMNEAHNMGIA